MNSKLVVTCALALTVIGARDALGAVVTIGASKDATIFQNPANNSSGKGNGLFAGTNGSTSPRRGLIRFDIAAAVPAGSTINSVELTLTLAQVAGMQTAGTTIELYRITKDWGEGNTQASNPPTDATGSQGQGAAAQPGDATWNANFYQLSTWTTAGGDFAAGPASATLDVGTALNTGYAWGTTALAADVQNWLDGAEANYGWILKNANEGAAANFRAFYSKDVATASFKPALKITYTIPEPSGILLAGGGMMIFWLRR